MNIHRAHVYCSHLRRGRMRYTPRKILMAQFISAPGSVKRRASYWMLDKASWSCSFLCPRDVAANKMDGYYMSQAAHSTDWCIEGYLATLRKTQRLFCVECWRNVFLIWKGWRERCCLLQGCSLEFSLCDSRKQPKRLSEETVLQVEILNWHVKAWGDFPFHTFSHWL
jgi:hypothetical protein